MKKVQVWLGGGVCLIIAGLVLGYGPFVQYWRSNHVAHATASPFTGVASAAAAPAQYLEGKPVHLSVQAASVSVDVQEGRQNQKTKAWTLSDTKAQYAVNTPLANNQAGSTFIYGHNNPAVFGKLGKIQPGDKAVVTTENGHTFTYVFRSAYQTDPNDTSVFEYQGPAILTIQTCSGMWFEHRQMFIFDLEQTV